MGEKNLEDYLRLFERAPDNVRAVEVLSSYLLSCLSYCLSKNKFVAWVLPVALRGGAKEGLPKNVRPAPKMDPKTRVRLQEAYRDEYFASEHVLGET